MFLVRAALIAALPKGSSECFVAASSDSRLFDTGCVAARAYTGPRGQVRSGPAPNHVTAGLRDDHRSAFAINALDGCQVLDRRPARIVRQTPFKLTSMTARKRQGQTMAGGAMVSIRALRLEPPASMFRCRAWRLKTLLAVM